MCKWLMANWEKMGCETKEEKYKETLKMIYDIAIDYDGCGDNLEKLRGLVDELRELAKFAIKEAK